MKGQNPAGERWRPGWHGGVSFLVALLIGQGAAADPPALPGGKATSSKGQRSRPAAALGHTVRPGDTLWTISRQHGVSVDALRRANGVRTNEGLSVGQRLMIPGAVIEGDRQEPPSLAEIVLGPPPTSRRIPFLWPVASSVASPFGPRGGAWHGGIDIGAARGTPIRAAGPGMVIMSGRERGYGNVIKIWHERDLMTVYAHNHENRVRVGEWVERGQAIATVGSTGRTTAPHLHFEIRFEGRKYDPLFWLPEPDVVATTPVGSTGDSAGGRRAGAAR